MQTLGLLGMYFDAAVVFVTNSSLLFRYAVLWPYCGTTRQQNFLLRMAQLVFNKGQLKSE